MATKPKPRKAAAKPKPKAAKPKVVNHRLTAKTAAKTAAKPKAKPKHRVVVVAQHGDGILGSIFPFLGAIGL